MGLRGHTNSKLLFEVLKMKCMSNAFTKEGLKLKLGEHARLLRSAFLQASRTDADEHYKNEIPLKSASHLFQRGFCTLPGAGRKKYCSRNSVLTAAGPHQGRAAPLQPQWAAAPCSQHIFASAHSIHLPELLVFHHLKL